jgi:hypothetical protein
VRIAGPSASDPAPPNRAQRLAKAPDGGSQTSVPVPTISVSMELAALKMRSS